MERLTKSKLIELRRKLRMLKESKKLLEERKKQLEVLRRKFIKELKELSKEYTTQLTGLRYAVEQIVERYRISEITDDASIQSQGISKLGEERYLGKVFVILEGVELPELRGDSVDMLSKERVKKALEKTISTGTRMDEIIKKAKILEKEEVKTTKKLLYIDKKLIPKIESEIRYIKSKIDEQQREELVRIKREVERNEHTE